MEEMPENTNTHCVYELWINEFWLTKVIGKPSWLLKLHVVDFLHDEDGDHGYHTKVNWCLI